jgi:hypothetical protein
MMTKLSPQAQAVLDAIQDELDATAELVPCTERIAAAVLKAVADLVAPERYCAYTGHGEFDFGMEARNDAVREEILAIAAELGGNND